LPSFEGTAWQVHVHVVTITFWLAMLAAQGWLAQKGKMEAHHRLGRLSYLLVPVIVAGFVLVTDYGQRRHKEPGWCLLLLMVLLTSVVAPQIMDGVWNAIWA
jgi:hypothetical protein